MIDYISPRTLEDIYIYIYIHTHIDIQNNNVRSEATRLGIERVWLDVLLESGKGFKARILSRSSNFPVGNIGKYRKHPSACHGCGPPSQEGRDAADAINGYLVWRHHMCVGFIHIHLYIIQYYT